METTIATEAARGAFLDSSILELSGMELTRAMVDGKLPRSPLSHLTGWEATQAGPGSATFMMPASPWFQSTAGIFMGGILAICADGALPAAIQTTLPPGYIVSSSDMTLNFLRPATTSSGSLIAHGDLTHAGRSVALADVHVEDGRGRLLAHGTSRCVILPVSAAQFPKPADDTPGVPQLDTPDPYLRPVVGETLPDAVWQRMTGAEIVRAQIAGELPMPPCAHLFGARYTEVSEQGSATVVMPATRWTCSPKGTMSGGVLALLATFAVGNATWGTLPAETPLAIIHLDVTFLRPVNPDGRDLVARGRVVHRGRTLVAATTEILDADGRQVALAGATSMIFPGRKASSLYRIVPADEETAPGA